MTEPDERIARGGFNPNDEIADPPAQPERTYPIPASIRLVLGMTDGSDYDLVLFPYAPAGATTIRFVELQGPGGVPVARWPLHDHGRGLHTICNVDNDEIEVVEA